MADPFAVTRYDLEALPPAVHGERSGKFCTRGRGGAPGFGDIWIALAGERKELLHLSAIDYLARRNLAAYDQGCWGFLDLSLVMEPGQTKITVTADVLERASVFPVRKQAESLSRRLALVTLIDHLALSGKRLTKDLVTALVIGLEMQTRLAKRQQAEKAAGLEGRLLAEGKSVRATVARVSEGLGIPESRVWTLRRSPRYQHWRDVNKAACTGGRPEPSWHRLHAADVWFAGISRQGYPRRADSVAKAIISLIINAEPKAKSGKRARLAPAELRWDLFNLFEVVNGRGHPPTEAMRVALDLALGLLDADGNVPTVALDGITDRDGFMNMALTEAEFPEEPTAAAFMDKLDSSGAKLLDPDRIAGWRRKQLYQTAVELLRDHANIHADELPASF